MWTPSATSILSESSGATIAGMARPKAEPEKKMVTLSTRIEVDKANAFKALAESLSRANNGYGPSVSQLLAQAIDAFMERAKRSRPRPK